MISKSITDKRWFQLVVIYGAACAGAILNTAFSFIAKGIEFPLFVDTIGTVTVAALFGLLPGIATAVLTHLFMELYDGFSFCCLPWVMCSVGSAVVVGVMRNMNRFRNLLDLLVAVILVTAANAVIGAIIATFLYGGFTAHPSDSLVAGFLAIGSSIFGASFWARIPLNLIDKGIAVSIAFLLSFLMRRRESEAEVQI
jgi:energy-coupling factor transport system substrate-specific component